MTNARKALESAREEIENERGLISGIDGYNYASGEEYGLRSAVIILDKHIAALASGEQGKGCEPLNLEQQFRPMAGYDKNQPGYQYREGWNAAIRHVMDLQRIHAAPLAPETRS